MQEADSGIYKTNKMQEVTFILLKSRAILEKKAKPENPTADKGSNWKK